VTSVVRHQPGKVIGVAAVVAALMTPLRNVQTGRRPQFISHTQLNTLSLS
jgi:hypothetical protein